MININNKEYIKLKIKELIYNYLIEELEENNKDEIDNLIDSISYSSFNKEKKELKVYNLVNIIYNSIKEDLEKEFNFKIVEDIKKENINNNIIFIDNIKEDYILYILFDEDNLDNLVLDSLY
jgi:hypothetical protein